MSLIRKRFSCCLPIVSLGAPRPDGTRSFFLAEQASWPDNEVVHEYVGVDIFSSRLTLTPIFESDIDHSGEIDPERAHTLLFVLQREKQRMLGETKAMTLEEALTLLNKDLWMLHQVGYTWLELYGLVRGTLRADITEEEFLNFMAVQKTHNIT